MNAFFDTVIYTIIGAGGFVIAFGLAVFIHELGHFLAAKFFGVPVERFVVGFDKEAMGFMPNCIWEKKIGETTYGLSIVPLGGYVKMIGAIHPDIEAYFDEGTTPPETKEDSPEDENAEQVEAATPEESAEKKPSLAEQALEDQEALYQKPFYQKFIIYAGGVFMNLVLAMFVIAFMSWWGVSKSIPSESVIGHISSESPFAVIGLEVGDRITQVEGTAVTNDDEFYQALSVELTEKYGEDFKDEEIEFAITWQDASEDSEKNSTVTYNAEDDGVHMIYLFAGDAHLDYVIQNKPANRAGLVEGDLIIEIDGEVIDDKPEAAFIIRSNPETELRVTVQREEGPFETILIPDESTDEKGVGQIGVLFGNQEKEIIKSSVGEALITAPGAVIDRTIMYVKNLGGLVGKLIGGNIKSVRESLGGPVAITQMAGYHANLGLERFLGFLIALNIALAVMNILPFPILDGGHIVLAAYEAVFGKPVPPKVLVPILNGALFFLLGFVLLVSFSDVLKLFGK